MMFWHGSRAGRIRLVGDGQAQTMRLGVDFLIALLWFVFFLPTLVAADAEQAASRGGPIFHLSQFRSNEVDGDDTLNINDAISAIYRKGGGTLILDSKRRYEIKRTSAHGNLGGIVLKPNVSLDGAGSTLELQDAASLVYYEPNLEVRAFVSRNISAGQNTVHVNNADPFAVGDVVYFRLGEEHTDPRESDYSGWSVIVGKTRQSLTLNVRFSHAVDISAISNELNKSIVLLSEPLEHVRIRNLRLRVGAKGNPEAGIYLKYAKDVLIENVIATNPGAGVLACQFCENIVVRNIQIVSSERYGARSKGRGFSFAETRGATVEAVRASKLDDVLIFAEASSRVTMRDVSVDNSNGSSAYVLLFAGQNSVLDVTGLHVHGNGGFVLSSSGGSRGYTRVRNLAVDVKSDLVSLGIPGVGLTGRLYYKVRDRIEEYDLDRPQRFEAVVTLEDEKTGIVSFGPGLIGSISLSKSDNLSNKELQKVVIALGRRAPGGTSGTLGINLALYLQRGIRDIPNTFAGTNGGALWQYRQLPVTLTVRTTGVGFTGTKKFVTLRIASYPKSR